MHNYFEQLLGSVRAQFKSWWPQDHERQVGALCYRWSDDQIEILLITTRRTGRWMIPKGWPMKSRPDHEAAAREAYEEAGAVGQAQPHIIGNFVTKKMQSSGDYLPHRIDVYPLCVEEMHDNFPESGQRSRQWFQPAEAISKCDDAGLRKIIARIDKSPNLLAASSAAA
jgi:8-oxo-dGTP pyrophosphatase MutT (NUDIX family)